MGADSRKFDLGNRVDDSQVQTRTRDASSSLPTSQRKPFFIIAVDVGMTNTSALYVAIEHGKNSSGYDHRDLQPIMNWPHEPWGGRAQVPTVIFYTPGSDNHEGSEKPTPNIKIGFAALHAEKSCRFKVNRQGSDLVCGRNFKLLLDPREVTSDLTGEDAERRELDRTIARAEELSYITNGLDMLEDFITGVLQHTRACLEKERTDFDASDSSCIRVAVALPCGWIGGVAQKYTCVIEKSMIRAGFGNEQSVPGIYLKNESEASAERALCKLSSDDVVWRSYSRCICWRTGAERPCENIVSSHTTGNQSKFRGYGSKLANAETCGAGTTECRTNLGHNCPSEHIQKVFDQAIKAHIDFLESLIRRLKHEDRKRLRVLTVTGGFFDAHFIFREVQKVVAEYNQASGLDIKLVCPKECYGSPVASGLALLACYQEARLQKAMFNLGVIHMVPLENARYHEYLRHWRKKNSGIEKHRGADGRVSLCDLVKYFLWKGKEYPCDSFVRFDIVHDFPISDAQKEVEYTLISNCDDEVKDLYPFDCIQNKGAKEVYRIVFPVDDLMQGLEVQGRGERRYQTLKAEIHVKLREWTLDIHLKVVHNSRFCHAKTFNVAPIFQEKAPIAVRTAEQVTVIGPVLHPRRRETIVSDASSLPSLHDEDLSPETDRTMTEMLEAHGTSLLNPTSDNLSPTFDGFPQRRESRSEPAFPSTEATDDTPRAERRYNLGPGAGVEGRITPETPQYPSKRQRVEGSKGHPRAGGIEPNTTIEHRKTHPQTQSTMLNHGSSEDTIPSSLGIQAHGLAVTDPANATPLFLDRNATGGMLSRSEHATPSAIRSMHLSGSSRLLSSPGSHRQISQSRHHLAQSPFESNSGDRSSRQTTPRDMSRGPHGPLTREEKTHLERIGACFYCRQRTNPPHQARDCPRKIQYEHARSNARKNNYLDRYYPSEGPRTNHIGERLSQLSVQPERESVGSFPVTPTSLPTAGRKRAPRPPTRSDESEDDLYSG
ncbi:hypothetical protein K491DRAFT_681149 [Lophiostoma macrostomum CBS 122681]|uniref:Actin-like ATPase domain-containing protein n=1 Tax=Lophiostoma macrostomum CBS 122681 TaxID=1314788 RepID=A0A6A6SY70_9PLEO|nr:hypothetical protein K491DRAFT_681149 [Lophiostoma macrostomum CBS 122681]